MKAKIYITQRSNDKYFAQKLPTFRNGFCYIERKVTFTVDPSGVYFDGEYGYITVKGEQVFVNASGNHFEIEL